MPTASRASRTGRSLRPRVRAGAGGAALATLGRPSLAMALLFAGLLLASAFVAIQIQHSALSRDAALYRSQITAADAYHQQLVADVAAKKTDDYVVNKARDYGYVLPGETLIGVQNDPDPVKALASAPSVTRAQRWLALFFAPH